MLNVDLKSFVSAKISILHQTVVLYHMQDTLTALLSTGFPRENIPL